MRGRKKRFVVEEGSVITKDVKKGRREDEDRRVRKGVTGNYEVEGEHERVGTV